MGRRKEELQFEKAEYYALLARAKEAEAAGDFPKAVEWAVQSWQYVPGMMQYERKYENREFKSVDTIDVVLEHAPWLFDMGSLNELERLLRSKRQIDRDASDDLAARLREAQGLCRDAVVLWNAIESHPGITIAELGELLGGSAAGRLRVIEAWIRLGALCESREGGARRLSLVTRMDEVVAGKCSECGVSVKGPKRALLPPRTCPKCKRMSSFAIVAHT